MPMGCTAQSEDIAKVAVFFASRMQDGSRTKDCWFPAASLDATVRQRNKPKAAKEESKSYEE